MQTDALAIANYFVKKSAETKPTYTLDILRLVKYVYIAYGFALALLDKSIIDPRFDKVEAWKYGPVIPSVYHSFKHFGKSPITEETTILRQEDDGEISTETPKVKDDDIKLILDFVWERYDSMDNNKLIDLLHKDGSPWKWTYEEGKNKEIYEDLTKLYYKKVCDSLQK